MGLLRRHFLTLAADNQAFYAVGMDYSVANVTGYFGDPLNKCGVTNTFENKKLDIILPRQYQVEM